MSINEYLAMASPATSLSLLKVDNLTVSLGDQRILQDLTFNLDKGEILCLLGHSGCGKTTALKAISGLIPCQQGTIEFNDRPLFNSTVNVSPEKRGIGFIFQDYALFPHLTIQQNIAYGLGYLNKAERLERVQECLTLVNLQSFAQQYPHELSGGQQQRGAVARALATRPQLLLMDEPFSNIDPLVKRQLIADLRGLLKELGISAIFVTHSRDEAFEFCDRMAVMMDGKIAQIDEPASIWSQPNSVIVAEFLEADNVIDIEDARTHLLDIPAVWPRSKSGGHWVFQPHKILIEKSLQKTGIKMKDHTFMGHSHAYTIEFIQKGNQWQVESDEALSLSPEDHITLSYQDVPYFIEKR